MTNLLRLQQLAKLLDVTRLQDDETNASFDSWLASLPAIPAAAYCVYPQYLMSLLNWPARQKPSAIATVVNFPSGDLSAERVCQQIKQALSAGVTEIDCVLPYKMLLRGEYDEVKSFLQSVRKACAGSCLKIIIESGELTTAQQITVASELVIEAGADFIKTSTGKVPTGVTEEAARIILTVIAAAKRDVGFKASGGVRTVEQALKLVELYEELTGKLALSSGLRIGASALVYELAERLAE
ncbi:deoxyribose-phosphate aldolase [Rheinheimera aquimaris]|uniref:Deoxyribose-phosphate aldolase n=1 Tax=Rheinheimera aquimaris TaxID=412437 RepID=A0ABN1EB53_9GAMM|nr:deoxyribose-phosphate aldolase [Rheinheimera aquimaris]MCB5215423.1 deoxyribose-phosphate aldolase [Rheinheimera aquimaris]